MTRGKVPYLHCGDHCPIDELWKQRLITHRIAPVLQVRFSWVGFLERFLGGVIFQSVLIEVSPLAIPLTSSPNNVPPLSEGLCLGFNEYARSGPQHLIDQQIPESLSAFYEYRGC